MKVYRLAFSALLLLVGLVWIGQGVGIIGGSAMSGATVWAVIGAALVVGAAVLAWSARRTARG